MLVKDSAYLGEQIRLKKSFLCVGLDPDLEKLPNHYLNAKQPFLEFCKDIIEVTHHMAVAYKINIAFFEALGPSGWEQLEQLVNIIPNECLLIADAKRADIGNTSKKYAEYYFDRLQVDAVTLHPYMGVDSLEPFLSYPNKWSVVLALTSNPGSADFELKELSTGELLFESVLQIFVKIKQSNQIMFVVGATHPEYLTKIRKICPDHFLLIPGIGSQGGDLHQVIQAGRNHNEGLLINVSRSIIYPELKKSFKDDVFQAAQNFVTEMSRYF